MSIKEKKTYLKVGVMLIRRSDYLSLSLFVVTLLLFPDLSTEYWFILNWLTVIKSTIVCRVWQHTPQLFLVEKVHFLFYSSQVIMDGQVSSVSLRGCLFLPSQRNKTRWVRRCKYGCHEGGALLFINALEVSAPVKLCYYFL